MAAPIELPENDVIDCFLDYVKALFNNMCSIVSNDRMIIIYKI